MLHRLPLVDQFLERVNADLQVYIEVTLGHLFIAFGGLDAAGGHRLVGDQQQGPGGDLVIKPGDKERGGFHVDCHGADAAQVSLELLVMLPDAAVGGVHGAGPVIAVVVADGGRDRFLQVEGGQGGDFGWEIIVRRAFAADGGNRQDQVAEFVLFLEPAAFAEEQRGFRLDGAQQVHDGGGVGAAHAKVDHGDAFRRGVGHGLVLPADGDIEPLREHVQVVVEVDQ